MKLRLTKWLSLILLVAVLIETAVFARAQSASPSRAGWSNSAEDYIQAQERLLGPISVSRQNVQAIIRSDPVALKLLTTPQKDLLSAKQGATKYVDSDPADIVPDPANLLAQVKIGSENQTDDTAVNQARVMLTGDRQTAAAAPGSVDNSMRILEILAAVAITTFAVGAMLVSRQRPDRF